jgi:hypothetical protein
MEKLYYFGLVYSLILAIGYEECKLAEEVRSISLKIPVSSEEIAGWEPKQT